MVQNSGSSIDATDPLLSLLTLPMQVGQTIMEQMIEASQPLLGPSGTIPLLDPEATAQWAEISARVQGMWMEYQGDATAKVLAGEAGGEAWRIGPARSHWSNPRRRNA